MWPPSLGRASVSRKGSEVRREPVAQRDLDRRLNGLWDGRTGRAGAAQRQRLLERVTRASAGVTDGQVSLHLGAQLPCDVALQVLGVQREHVRAGIRVLGRLLTDPEQRRDVVAYGEPR